MLPINDKRIEEQSAFFQKRNEPNFAWVNAIGAACMFPQLRGFWPMSTVASGGNVIDHSNLGKTLTNHSITFGLTGLVPYAILNGAAWLDRADEADLDITGALAMCGWYYFTANPAAVALMCKFGAAGQYGYAMLTIANKLRLSLSVDGTAVAFIDSVTPLTTGVWTFCAVRYVPSVSMSVLVNKEWTRTVVGVPAGIFNNTTLFEIGRVTAALYMTGYSTLNILAASAASEVIINSYYEQTRALFGR